MPSANTLVVERADRLGLAQMYQLRGRVGRSAERAFAYFFFPPTAELTEEAHGAAGGDRPVHRRSGRGFPIAMRDLEIRGAGNLLGAEQHGHIAAVGFDTYVQLLAEVGGRDEGRARSGGARGPDRPAGRGRSSRPGWLEQESLRLELYRRISMASDAGALAAVRAETSDRFGALPEQVESCSRSLARMLADAPRRAGNHDVQGAGPPRTGPALRGGAARRWPSRVAGATFHAAKQTLNLQPSRVYGVDLVRWVTGALVAAVRTEPAA